MIITSLIEMKLNNIKHLIKQYLFWCMGDNYDRKQLHYNHAECVAVNKELY